MDQESEWFLDSDCKKYIVFLFQRFLNIPDSCFFLFYLGVSVCTHTRQVEHQQNRQSSEKSQNFKEKKHNI